MSTIADLAATDARVRAQIAARKCPRCSRNLTPRVPSDPTRVFGEGGVQYEAYCPEHGTVT